jgi:hypothetical protein
MRHFSQYLCACLSDCLYTVALSAIRSAPYISLFKLLQSAVVHTSAKLCYMYTALHVLY